MPGQEKSESSLPGMKFFSEKVTKIILTCIKHHYPKKVPLSFESNNRTSSLVFENSNLVEQFI